MIVTAIFAKIKKFETTDVNVGIITLCVLVNNITP